MPQKIVKSKIIFEGDIQEKIAEVSTEQYPAWQENARLNVVGKPISRIDAYDKVSGTAVYTIDKLLPRMAYARTLRSPHPHAKIKKINLKEALKVSGVLDIITHENSEDISWYWGSSKLFDPHLRYQGDEIACVAAESAEIAEYAIKKIEVIYEELPFEVNTEKAYQIDSQKLTGFNKSDLFEYERGDLQKGIAESEVEIENTYTTQVEIHNPTEVHCSVVNWDGGKLTVWDSTQAVFSVRNTVADSLNLDSSDIRIIKKYMGGGFGSKLEAGKYTVMAALLAKRIGRPVKIYLDRREMNLAVGNRPDSYQTLKLWGKKNGDITAMSYRSFGASGAYPQGAGASWPFRTMYKCPNLKVEDQNVFINAGRARAFRAPGHVQGTFALDALIDDYAYSIGLDPLEVRLKNYAEIDQVYDVPYTSKLLKEAYSKGAEAIGWNNRNKIPGSGKGVLKRGIGMASQIWWGGGGPPAHVNLKMDRDGALTIISGTQDLGTGTYTILAQVAAEVLELPIEKIEVILGDTAVCPYGPSSGGSQTISSVAPAVRDAAEKMKAKILSAASAILEKPESEIEYSRGSVIDKSVTENNLPVSEIMRKMREQTFSVTGLREANPDRYAANSFGAQFADVSVDTETGKITVNKIVAAHDIGRTMNRQTLENQFHGGIIQGLSFALMEERVMDEMTGKAVNLNMYDYKIPTVTDVPKIEIIIVSEGDHLLNSVGAKGVGEPAMIPTPGAVANAVFNAIGVRIKSLPITPDKVLNALYQKV